MSAQLKESSLFKIERREGLRGKWETHDIGLRPDWPLKPEPGNAVRITRMDREKPLPLKLAHSARRNCERHQDANHSVEQKAKFMAEHIRRTGQTELPLFYTGREAWPSGVPSSVRDFNAALVRELSGDSLPVLRGRCARPPKPLPECYRVAYVDPSKDVTSHDD